MQPRGDLSLTVSQRKLACVLDPALVLGSAAGLRLALRLTQVLEPWLTRSFWQVVDDSERLLHCLATQDGPTAVRGLVVDAQALTDWVRLREQTPIDAWPLRSVGDSYADTHLRDTDEPDLVDRYEWLLAAMEPPPGDNKALTAPPADWDALALSACLDGSAILCALSDGEEPAAVRALHHMNIEVQKLEPMPEGSLFMIERQLLREALALAGLAPVSAQLPRMAVAHALVPGCWFNAAPDLDGEAVDPWAGAKAWWYPL